MTRGFSAIVDLKDFERFGHLKWCALPMVPSKGCGVYARRGVVISGRKIRTILLHREIIQARPGEIVDHINGNTLDCRRENLRITDRLGNRRNSRTRVGKSGFIGVHRRGSSWRGRVKVIGKVHYTQPYPSPVLAAAARDVLAQQLHGDFAVLNFTFTAVQPSAA